MLKFNAKLLAAVALARSTDDSRYYLCGVMFQGYKAVATDGHIMTVATDTDLEDADHVEEQHIMPVSKKAITAMKNKKAETVTFENDVLSVITKKGEVLHLEPSKEIDATYPDYERVIPDLKNGATQAAFGPAVLSRIADTGGILGKSVPISFAGDDEKSGHIVTYHHHPDVMSVAMPIRKD